MSGLQNLVSQLQHGVRDEDVIAQLIGPPENQDNAIWAYLEQLYRDALGRAPIEADARRPVISSSASA
jgi:hypothetical protein